MEKAIAVVIHSDGTAYSAEMFAGRNHIRQLVKDADTIIPAEGAVTK